MSTQTKIAALATAFLNFRTAVLAALSKKVAQVSQSDNATKIGGKTPTQLINTNVAAIAEHVTAVNPHGVTPEILGTLATVDINKAFSKKINQGAFPISAFRCEVINVVDNKQINTYNATMLLSGIGSVYPQTEYWSLNQTLVPGNAYHLFLIMREGTLGFIVAEEPIPEDETNMWLCQFTAVGLNNYYIQTVAGVNNEMPMDIRRIDIFRVSDTSSGSSFLSTYSDPESLNDEVRWK